MGLCEMERRLERSEEKPAAGAAVSIRRGPGPFRLIGIAIALLFAVYPAAAMRVEQAGGNPSQENRTSVSGSASSEFLFALPKGDLSLRLSYLPERNAEVSSNLLLERANLSLIGSVQPRQEKLFLRGKKSLLAEYKPSSFLQMRFSYDQSLRPKREGEAQEIMSSNLSYGLTFTPSSNSRLTAAWKWLKSDRPGAPGSASTQSAEFGYEMKFTGGLMRLGRKMALNSDGLRSDRQETSSMHMEWGRAQTFSLAADYASKNLAGVTEQSQLLAAKIAFSPQVKAGLSLRRLNASGKPAEARSDLSLDADLGSSRAPFRLTGRVIEASQGKVGGELREAGFQGGFGKDDFGLRFSGAYGKQRGILESRPAGSLGRLQLEARLPGLKLIGKSEVLPQQGGLSHKRLFEARLPVSPAAEISWLRQSESGFSALEREQFAVNYHLQEIEVGLGHEQRLTTLGSQESNSLRLLWKAGRKLPEWAKSLGESPISEESAKYGFRPAPSWAKAAEPGLEASWRKRSSASCAASDSLRLVYRGLAGGVHLRAGHETNPWAADSAAESVNLGQRDFVEIGMPLQEKFVALLRLSQKHGLDQDGGGLLLSLGANFSNHEKLESFYSSEPEPQLANGLITTRRASYGVIYSHNHGEEQYLTVKASINPPAAPDKNPENWRLDLAFSQPF